jgi:N6-adenosine-specific RNA methylase IME4
MSYEVIVADPPWSVMAGPLMERVGDGWAWPEQERMQTRPLPYETMSVPEMAALPVADLAAPDAALYLWTINAYVEQAYDIARAWGFKPSTLCVWAKNPMGGGLGGSFGISTEFFLYARKGSPVERRTVGTWFNWKRHYVNGYPAHSAKPDPFYDLAESRHDGPFVELFARRARLGWDYWGDESLGTATMGEGRGDGNRRAGRAAS